MLIELKNVSHIYDDGQVTEALRNINLTIREREFIGLVGHTGSGKSTLVQLLNGLIKPSTGTITIDGLNITEGKTSLLGIRRKIGLVFQYPEHQLFEETIYGDVAFGPRNLQLEEEEVEIRVREALELVGLDYEEFKDRSPFNLSGGQQRKVAIAGVLAMKPEVLILDEPSAGLDPQGRQQLINLLEYLYEEKGMTIILVSHRMEEIARLSNRVIVMSEGEIIFDDRPEKVFSEVERIRQLGLDLPEITEILWRLNKKGLQVRTDLFSLTEAVEEISKELRGVEPC
ncbi:MAG TPA: energy-coupling factor transporter ATPase [Halanaerobiales bacterium]|nr:energy-coupling factor transporter ATPase [Halanaerobiales bacterium]HQD03527.1 energy-coupling factor transporter ATPase [Halanaerobiales bacterium]